MKNIYLKITIILLMICVIPINSFVIAAKSGATGGTQTEETETETGLGLGTLDNYAGDGGTSTNFDLKINNFISVIQVIASITSVAVLIVLGVKYMISGIEERAEYKKTMMPYIIGACMVFGISAITGILYQIATNMLK